MTSNNSNLLIIMSDEHQTGAMGCAGHPIVKTPNLDTLAKNGTYFTNAYTPSPICVPARAAFATGYYTHQTGYWCNAHPYDGKIKGWTHRLQENNTPILSIGKLHYRDEADPTGFDTQIAPMHVVDGIGDIMGAVRDKLPPRPKTSSLAERIGPGNSSYIEYDNQITMEAEKWLKEHATKQKHSWVLFVSLVCPHFPLISPPEFFDLYPPKTMPLPRDHPETGIERHPWIDAQAKCQLYDQFFTDETRRIAISSYFGLCTFLDHNIGKILRALDSSGESSKTRVIYTSDHGDNLGARGLWGKSNMYEESVGIPLITAGPDIPKSKKIKTPVSLLDFYPTILDAAGIEPNKDDKARPGKSLWKIADQNDDVGRVVFSEYHAVGAATGCFMIRKRNFKYVYYVDYPAQLFDLESDPLEQNDLINDPSHVALVREFEKELRHICDPELVDQRAKRDQATLVEKHGGRDAVLKRGSFNGTPAPGEKAIYG